MSYCHFYSPSAGNTVYEPLDGMTYPISASAKKVDVRTTKYDTLEEAAANELPRDMVMTKPSNA